MENIAGIRKGDKYCLKNILIIISVFIFISAGCMAMKKAGPPVVYEGELPCKGCKGVMTTLTLKGDMTYTMKETFLFEGEKPRFAEIKGRWAPLKGFRNDNTAIVYRLLPDNQGDVLYFLMTDAKTIRKLNKKGEIIKSNKSYSLKKKI